MSEDVTAPAASTLPDDADGADDDRWRAPKSSFPWPPVVIIGAFVIVSAVVIGYQVTRPPPSGPKVLTDQAFIDRANRACQAAIPALRPQDTSRADTLSPAEIADQSDRAADGLTALAQELREIPVAAEQETFVQGWLDSWGTFIGAGRQYARAVRTGDVDAANEVARAGDPAQRRADAFARGNDLDSCILHSAIRKPADA